MKRFAILAACGLMAATLTVQAEDVYATSCAKCHGADGKGQTAMGKKLGAKDYSSKETWAKLTDEQALKGIKEGVTVDGKKVMKGFGESLTAEQIAETLKAMKSLAK